jgi:pimeloyl-ACP methyl ester carboxylesterase
MPIPFRDALVQAQWQRTAGHAWAGGADLGECLTAAEAIDEARLGSWYDAWMRLAERLERGAEASRASGHAESACGAYLRASNYYRSAYVFLMQPNPDARLADAYRRQRATFTAALGCRPGFGEAIAIPYEGTTLPGYFHPAAGTGRRPTVILNGGYDGTAEETFFYSGPAALARGYNVVTFDGPGQGGALVEKGLVFRPDWESVIAPVLACVAGRPEVDAAKIALMGISFGGYLAPRAATGVPGIAALIADPGQCDLLAEARTRMPAFIGRALPDGNRFVLALLSRILARQIRHPTRGWGLRRGLYVHGVATPLEYLRLTAQYTSVDRIGNIRCPTFVANAENDEIGATGPALFAALTAPKTYRRFLAAEGAGAHCESGARTLFNQVAFDWLDGILAAGKM